MRHHFVRPDEIARRGITPVEVVAIIIILLLLLSIVLPAMLTTRISSRGFECANNLKALALATTGFATSQGGKIPLLSEPAPGLASDINCIWTVQLLPFRDNAGAIEYITEQKTPKEAEVALGHVLEATFKALQCPLDPNRFRQPGALSYGANIGYGAWRGTPQGVTTDYDFRAVDHSAAAIDWNHNGKLDTIDKDVARATGVFWFADEDDFRLTLDDIMNGDGTGQTILFAETMNLPLMHLAGSVKNGHNPAALDAGIGLGYKALGLKTSTKPNLLLDRAAKATPEYQQYFAPNTNHGTSAGKWPAASSAHSGGVNVVYADGHVG
ncbi:MAG: hypothetical protein JWN70_670, partial [Planctomycetaceae bacterium]|nr:hypothetical protein [Planctomycetaceae bacterium]